MNVATSSPASGASGQSDDDIRVIIVDDSAVIRGLIARAIEGQSGIRIVGTASNGQVAVDLLKREAADVVILDIEMPVMDGLTAIPKLKEVDKGVQIVMASTLTSKNAEISIRAMELGATDYIPKPTSAQEMVGAGPDSFNGELINKVRALGVLARRRGVRPPSGAARAKPAVFSAEKKKIVLRTAPVIKPEVIGIGSSTGGPQALFTVIKAMGPRLAQPVVITQHMPPAFTPILAEHITRQSGVTCTEAKDGDSLRGGHYYVAPGDFHMLLARKGSEVVVRLTKDAPENYCRPAVDPMMRSLVECYRNKILAVILTGMGQDGMLGCKAVVEAGGSVFAQDEASSVVWGMPGAAAGAGVCSAILPVDDMGAAVRKVAQGGGAS